MADDAPPPGDRPPPRFLHMTPAEWVTGGVAFASLVVAIAGFANTVQNHDTSEAVKKLADLATQTKRQADASEQQLAEIKAQVAEAHAQTASLSAQTAAIKETAVSAAHGAVAQQKSADIASRNSQPEVALTSLDIRGIGSPVDPKDGLEHTKLIRHSFTNVGGSPVWVTRLAMGFNSAATDPGVLNTNMTWIGQGNEVVVRPGQEYSLVNTDSDIKWPAGTGQLLNSGRARLFVYGVVDYRDQEGKTHHKCFGYVVAPPKITGPDASWEFFAPVPANAKGC